MKFPTEKNKVLILAQTVNNGLTANQTVFPSPPVSPAAITAELTAYAAARDQIIAKEAELRQLYIDESADYESIETKTKQNIKYGESVANGDAAKLALIGWGNPSAPVGLQPPGQCRAFEIIGQGDGWVEFDWKDPTDGGRVASYIVQRSEDGINFVEAKTETRSEATLVNQPKGKSLIYQVIGINKAGEGLASNTVSLTL